MKLCLRVIAALVFISSLAAAQVSTGTPAYGSFGGGPFDSVNLGNLNVHFEIPILNKAGRIPFFYNLSYDSSVWYPVTTNGTTQWTSTQNWGWLPDTAALLGYLQPSTIITQTYEKPCEVITATTKYAYIDSKNRSHPIPGSTYYSSGFNSGGSCTGSGYGPNLIAQTTDGSGYSINIPANQIGPTVTTLSGQVVSDGIGINGGTYTDANGNQLTVNNSSGQPQYFDTLSSMVPVLTQAGNGTPTSPVTLTYTAPSANPASYTVNYTSYTVKTNFGFVPAILDVGPGTSGVYLVSSITLPDGTSYSFRYEATPDHARLSQTRTPIIA